MKIAYCILCHKYTSVLQELVSLTGESNDVFVHVDAKADIRDFDPLADKANFLSDRVDVAWGKYSLIEASLRLLDSTRQSRCDYVALISGDTLPIRSDAEIKRYLWENRGREFIFERPLEPHHPDRLRYRYPGDDARRRGLAAKAWRMVQRRLKLLPRNKYFETLPPLAFGSNWLVITPEFRNYMFDYLGQHPEYTEAFRYGECGDELFFATLINQSPFAGARDPRRYMYVDWQTGPQYPRTLDASDFDRLAAAAAKDSEGEYYLFARKFADDLDLAAFRARFTDKTTER